jgi:hypothetical protein
VETDGLVSFFKNRSVELYNAMSEIGYKLVDVKCLRAEEPVTPVTIEKIMFETFAPRRSMDVRA